MYVLPDGYLVSDPSLEDISFVLAPAFSKTSIANLSAPSHLAKPSYDLSGKAYIPGYIGLNNIKYNLVFIFVGWDCFESVIWYLFGVETVGRTLEELEEVFSARNPAAASKKKEKLAIKKDGEVVLLADEKSDL